MWWGIWNFNSISPSKTNKLKKWLTLPICYPENLQISHLWEEFLAQLQRWNSVYYKGLKVNSAFCVLSVFIFMTLKTITLLLLLLHTDSNSRISGNPFQAKSASPYQFCYKLCCFSFIWVMNSPGVLTNMENSISRPQLSPCNIKCLMI